MKYLNALNKISGIGPQKTRKLLSFFKTPENAWKASLKDLINSGIGEKTAETVVQEKSCINPEEEWEKLEKNGIKMIAWENSDYPEILREIPNPPYIIYTRGNYNFEKFIGISVVGSRKYTSYGAQIARSFAGELAKANITVVSGMAIGIDTFAHRGALEEKGKTIAVLGNSLDDNSIYPRNNFNLSREISQQGLLLSEYPIKTSAGPLTFPARNRIIAGLSLGTLVIEASENSGALITAKMALDYNREIFSVPGSIFSSQSIGTNNLIKSGARVVTSIKDILEELDLNENEAGAKLIAKIPSSKEEEIILKILSSDPLHIDIISKLSRLEVATVSSTLSIMEIKGWTKNIGGQNYIII
ncbi:MAG TPA: DNA-processing protein DprA [Candidatus Moranbacteria bacterium]|nr:DNA-processing protein DprA [Candidatus Moranbacteria bacterium]